MHVLIYRSIYSFLYFFLRLWLLFNLPMFLDLLCYKPLTSLELPVWPQTLPDVSNLTRRLKYPWCRNSCSCPLANGLEFLSISTIESHRAIGLRYSLHLYRKPPKYKQTNGIRIKRFNVTTKNFYLLASSLFSVEFQPVFYTFLIFLHYFSPSDPLLCTPSKPLPLLLHNHRLSWFTIIIFPIHSIYHWILRHSVS